MHNQTYRVENYKLTSDNDWPYQYWHYWAHSTAHKPLLDSSSVKIGGDITDKNMLIDLSKLLQQSDGRRINEWTEILSKHGMVFQVQVSTYIITTYNSKNYSKATVATGSM